jgi:hypothetical protein
VRSILGKKKDYKLRASTATKNFMFFFYRTPTQPVESMFDFIRNILERILNYENDNRLLSQMSDYSLQANALPLTDSGLIGLVAQPAVMTHV